LPLDQSTKQSSHHVRNAAFRTLVTVILLAYFVETVQWRLLWTRFMDAEPRALLLACALLGLAYVLSGIRWWFLLRVQQIDAPLRAAVKITFIAQFFNAFMLGAVGGDVIRAMMVMRYGRNQRTNASLSVLIDRVLGLLVMLICTIAMLPWQHDVMSRHPELRSVVLALVAVFLALLCAGVLIAVWPFHRSPPWVARAWEKVPRRHILSLLLSGYRAHYSAAPATAYAIAAAFGLTFVLIVAGMNIASAIGVQVSFITMLQIFTVATCVISLPISIGGHGVREGIFVFLFAAYGLSLTARNGGGHAGADTAVLFSLIFFGLSSVWSVVGGVLYFFQRFVPQKSAPT
jgi:uncharacterized protein (TIRG00374 family)